MHGPVVDQKPIQCSAADRIVEDGGHFPVGPRRTVGNLAAPEGGARQLAKQRFPVASRRRLAGRRDRPVLGLGPL